MRSHTTYKKHGNSEISLDRKYRDLEDQIAQSSMRFVVCILSLGITVAVVDAVAPASDKASNSPYEPGNTWVNAQNGGSGFGWRVLTSATNSRLFMGTSGNIENTRVYW